MVAKKTAAKKSAARKTSTAGAVKDVTGKKSTVAKKAATKTAAKTATAKKTAARNKKTAAKKTTAEKAPAVEKAPATKKATAARKAAPTKAAAKKAPAAKKAAAKKSAVKKKAASAAHVEQTGAGTVAAKKTAGGVTTAESEAAVPQARTGELAVRPGEDPWTPEEVAEARAGLESEVLRLRAELLHSKEELTGLMRDSGDGAGDDQADTGTKNITREHELALAANAREMLEQSEHALERLDAGTYGLCEVCGKPIGKARMQAFPRATLCVEDKQKQERRG
ncbi:TraR/DksA family transcriptional regulator [Streptomyces sp. P9(2023)]|uniref:TraR/DksA family transcriptional regulator n=1 Tax=Streptomyces sp. P9(2023) TaxID=3064394 RepID=UPI0028F45922|nr:TraR/DksA family transcriptional regulator [Streptomyces sp. P9(2023)]MDT9687916.1 TraR/DksA family transcriptional regulator [Streptomyces sp. P9(2023)]